MMRDQALSDISPRTRWVLSAILLVVLFCSVARVLDRRADQPVGDAFQRALVTFAVVRGINAVISVVQHTELAIEPAGVGVVLAPGQVFDPVNDLIERFSWMMLAASTSLGAQQVMLKLGTGLAVQAAAVVALAMLALALWRPGWVAASTRSFMMSLALLVLFVRFSVPLVVLLNDALYWTLLDDRYQASYVALERTRNDVEALNAQDTQQRADEGKGSLGERLGRWYERTTGNLDILARIELYKNRLSGASEHIVHLIVVFTLQTIVFPLLFLWMGLRVLRTLVRAL